jgi:1,2-diacylglycerol 3-beta-glucosyltransferase
VITAALLLLALPGVLGCAYLLLLTLASAEPETPAAPARRLRFDLVVPAHDEERGIAGTVESLLGLDWPAGLFRVLVVADNCSDATAAVAAKAGATVLERKDAARRGKGFALAFAFERVLAGGADAAVVIDADTLVSPNLLDAFARRLESGAAAVQADYAVRNPGDSWRTRLIAIALGAFHVVRSRGRERLGLSCGLRGNGMCFSRQVLERVPHTATSLVEDLEYGILLAEQGFRVHYAGEAHVYGEMVSSDAASRSQRARWEDGRRLIRRKYGFPLLARALRSRDRILTDIALDVLVPPLAQLALWVLVIGGVSGAARYLGWGGAAPLWAALFSAGALVCYVARGWQLSGTGARGLGTLALAPAYVAWKLALPLLKRGRAKDEWLRTRRQGEGDGT